MQFSKSKILCIGDIILDSYEFGAVKKISPEAPIPIFKSLNESYVLGGAGNVARNISSGGANCHILSVIGDDLNGKIIRKKISEIPKLKSNLIIEKNRKTTKKKRFISDNQQVLRVDEEVNDKITSETEKKLLSIFKEVVSKFDVIILSDYDKGVLTEKLIQDIIKLSKKRNKIVIVDPKRQCFSLYRGANIITPNFNELIDASKIISNQKKDEIENITFLSKELSKRFSFDTIITTRSSKGMQIYQKNKEVINLKSEAVEVYDVSGAGDTVVAYLALGLSAGNTLYQSALISNKAAGIAVGKFGTASVSASELIKEDFFKKIVSDSKAKEIIHNLNEDKIVGFTNGCFDLIHFGHIKYFIDIKKHCDFLILGLNSDISIKLNKGKLRPIMKESERAKILACFPFIDLIILFNEKTPLALMKKLKPNIIFKGKDYLQKKVVGKEDIKKWGGKLILIDYLEGLSTTNILKRIRDAT